MSNNKVVRFPTLSREDMMQAVRDGVRDAFLEVMTDGGYLAVVSTSDICSAIKEGTNSAIWSVATSGTHMPSSDFYEAIKRGVEDGLSGIAS